MLAAVDPSDTAKLDEIDARVWAYLKLQGDFNISFSENSGTIHYRHNSWPKDVHTVLHHTFQHDQYTRSRDALKAIRPEGWVFGLAYRPTNGEWVFGSFKPESIGKATWIDDNWDDFAEGKTEELAELHAIIQAIVYQRAHP